MNNQKAERDLRNVSVRFAIEGPVGGSVQNFLVDRSGKRFCLDHVAVRPRKFRCIRGRRRHLQNGQPVDVCEGLLRSHQNAAESFSVHCAHHGCAASSDLTNCDCLAFAIDLDFVRWREGHAVVLQFRRVELIHRPIRNEQPIADEQRLHSRVDEIPVRFVVVVSRCGLLRSAADRRKPKSENAEQGRQRNPAEHGHRLLNRLEPGRFLPASPEPTVLWLCARSSSRLQRACA